MTTTHPPATISESGKPSLEQRLVGLENWGRVAALTLRGILGWRFAAALLLLVGAGAWLTYMGENLDIRTAHTILGRVFAGFALVLASPLLPDERSRGTLEILWMASGSMRRLLRWKEAALLTGAFVCILPVVLLTGSYLRWETNIALEIISLLTQTWLVATWTFYVGSYLPHAWAGGLVAAAVLLSAEWPLSRLGGSLNPFMNIYDTSLKIAKTNTLIVNQIWVLFLGWFLHDQTARRARFWIQ